MVEEFVSTWMFERAKFLNMDKQMGWSTDADSACQVTLARLNVSEMVDQEAWWAVAKRWIHGMLRRLSSDRNTAMKRAFFGTFVMLILWRFSPEANTLLL
jgi:hypothetical protein